MAAKFVSRTAPVASLLPPQLITLEIGDRLPKGGTGIIARLVLDQAAPGNSGRLW